VRFKRREPATADAAGVNTNQEAEGEHFPWQLLTGTMVSRPGVPLRVFRGRSTMWIPWHRVVWVAGVLAAAALTPVARAQVLVPVRTSPPAAVGVPTVTTLRVQTTVVVPDGGGVLLGGYGRVSEGRASFGAPILGQVPSAGRGFRNVGYGREVVSGRVTASVRIIDLREEEFRQTGVRGR